MPVVDASLVVDWVAPDADPQGPARRTLARLTREGAAIVAPRLLLAEVANALLSGLRRTRWSGAEADAAFVRLLSLPVEVADQPSDLERAWELSRRYDEHPVYDMVYVALAERTHDLLLTADQRLLTRLAGRGSVVGPG